MEELGFHPEFPAGNLLPTLRNAFLARTREIAR
jgi:hypothetical protein